MAKSTFSEAMDLRDPGCGSPAFQQKIAQEYRASEQDAHFSRKRIAFDDYTDPELSEKLL